MSYQVDSYGNVYFPAGVSVGNYPITLNTPTHVLVAGAGGLISKVATNQLISNTDVTSVFGRTGNIVPSPADYTSDMVKEVTNLYFTNARARASISLTTVGSTGPATYNAATGVLNVPQYQNDFNGVSSFNTRTGAVTLTALDVTTALTYTPVAIETDPIWGAQKVLYYTKVESDANFASITHTHTTTVVTEGTNLYFTNTRARAAITLTTTGTSGAATYTNGVFNIPNYTTDLTGYATETYVNTQVSNLVDAAPTTLNTLNELAAALGDDANFSTTITTLIGTKEPAITAGTTAQYWRGDKTWQNLPSYSLPIASATVLGGIKVGSNLSINAEGVLSAGNSYVLPIASPTVLGGIKVGTNLSIDANGVLSSTDTNTTYANFTRTVSGLVPNPGGSTTNRYLREDGTWVIPPDTDTNTWNANTRDVAGYVAAPGAVANKVWKTDASGNPAWRDDADTDTIYTLPTATGSVLGGVKIGNGISISSGVISNYLYDSRNTRGATRLYRRDDDSNYSLQTYWTGTHWYLRGYNADDFHAEVRVGYSDSTGSVAWTNVSGRPTAVSSFTNDSSYITSASNVVGLYSSGYGDGNFTWRQDNASFAGYGGGWASYLISNHGDGSNYYNHTLILPFWGPPKYSRREANVLKGPFGFITDENIGGQSVNYAASAGTATDSTKLPLAGGTLSNRLTIDSRTTNNLPLYLLAVEPELQIEATGATNPVRIKMYPSGGTNALIGNYSSGELVLIAANTEVAYLNSNSIRVAKYRFNGNATLSGNGTAEIVDIANVGMAMQSLNYRWYNNTANVLYMTLNSTGLTATAFFESSDIRYKNVIETNPSLSLDGLDVIKFTRKGSSIIRYGYSAQQVKSLSEDLVGGTKDELTVNYSDVHTLKIAALEKRIAELEAKLK